MIKAGDKVVVVRSPYDSIKNGTIASVTGLIPHHFGPPSSKSEYDHMYILGTLSHPLFRYGEIALVEEK